MIRTIIWWIWWPIGLLAYIPRIKNLERQKTTLSKTEYRKKAYEIARSWAKTHLYFAGVSEKKDSYVVKGRENIIYDRPTLYVANHQSNFDTAILMVDLDVPKGFVAKIELSNIPILSKMMGHMGCIFIDRNEPKSQLNSILTGIEYLKEGHSICIYPEGTRGKDTTLGEFKAGSFKLATKTNVPIVPITINGTYNLLEKNNNKLKKANVELIFHSPIETSTLTKEEKSNLNNTVKAIIEKDLWK
ncbi:MAG: lysophospholipid acyltransferase family protein [Lachnospirales bacterium]